MRPTRDFMDTIVYAVYSSPPLASVFSTGEIKNANMVRAMDFIACEHWIRQRLDAKPERYEGVPVPRRSLGDDFKYMPPGASFEDELRFLNANLDNGPGSKCYLHRQTKLFDIPQEAAAQVEAFLQRVLDLGGEGVVVRNPLATWTPKRHKDILKHKPFKDAEARIIGFTSGRETGKGSRLSGQDRRPDHGLRGQAAGTRRPDRRRARVFIGRDGSLRVGQSRRGHARPVPGSALQAKGQVVTFKYRELSDDGIPKEARLWRRRDVE